MSGTTTALQKGEYRAPGPDDLRSPCPLVNSLANHGIIPRDGRNILADELAAGARGVGLSTVIAALLSYPIFNERYEEPQPSKGLIGNIYEVIRNPWSLMASFALRNPGQVDSLGRAVVNLDQIGRHGVIEHDVSLLRRDTAQGDATTKQPDLIDALLASTTNGKTCTAEDLSALRVRRIEQQKKDNDKLDYGPPQNGLACGEIAMVLRVFGDGKQIPCEYASAFFKEERLPTQEGWTKRAWWNSLGAIELVMGTNQIKKLIGFKE